MTEPEVPFNFNLSSGVTTGLDGKLWPVIEMEIQLTKFTFALPVEACEKLAKIGPSFFTQAAAIARRSQLGLIIPQNGNTPTDVKKLREPGQ